MSSEAVMKAKRQRQYIPDAPPLNYKCPHCGMIYDAHHYGYDLTPEHDTTVAGNIVIDCPGSKQHPRGMADLRPLWRDGGVS